MQAEVVKTFRFEAAHALPNVPPEHKCRRVHGHGYRVDVHVIGEVGEETGWVMDYAELKRAVEPVLEKLDHNLLNEVDGLANSTTELLAKYIWDRIVGVLGGLSAVVVWESQTNRCVYRGG